MERGRSTCFSPLPGAGPSNKCYPSANVMLLVVPVGPAKIPSLAANPESACLKSAV